MSPFFICSLPGVRRSSQRGPSPYQASTDTPVSPAAPTPLESPSPQRIVSQDSKAPAGPPQLPSLPLEPGSSLTETGPEMLEALCPEEVVDGITSSCPPFPEEVWINILRFVRGRAHDPHEAEEQTDAPPGQRDLARMMRVSSMIHDLAGAVLYRSVVTQDLDALMYGLFPCRRSAYFARLQDLLGKRAAVRRHCGQFGHCMAGYGCHGGRTRDLPAPGESDDPLAYLQLDDLLPMKRAMDEEIAGVHLEVLQMPEEIIPGSNTIPSITRQNKRSLLRHIRRLHLSSPRDFESRERQLEAEGLEDQSDHATGTGDGNAITPDSKTQLGFFFGLYQAISYLKQQQESVFVEVEHLSIGKKYESRLEYSPGLFDADSGESTALHGIRKDACALLTWFVRQLRPRTICRFPPHLLVEWGSEDSPLCLSETRSAAIPLVTLHNFSPRSISDSHLGYGRGDYVVGGRIRYIVDPTPQPSWSGSYEYSFSDVSNGMKRIVSNLHRLFQSLQKCPEWSVTEFEIVIPRIAETVLNAALSATSRPTWSTAPRIIVEEWNDQLLAKFRRDLQGDMQRDGITAWETHIRVITDLNQSPWENCPCSEEQ